MPHTLVDLQHFTRKVVPQKCNPRLTKVEEEYDDLSSFFKAACIPGDWTASEYRDKMLSESLQRGRACINDICHHPCRFSFEDIVLRF